VWIGKEGKARQAKVEKDRGPQKPGDSKGVSCERMLKNRAGGLGGVL